MVFAANVRKTIMGNYSTLNMLDMAIGDNTSAKWLVLLVNDLNKFSGSKNMEEEQAESLAYLLAQEYKDVKYSVIQLFFFRFKCGDFGKFYGKVDPMVITCALKDFMEECERKRQQYLTEEYNQRKAEEDARRQKMREKWDACQSELWSTSPDEEGKKLFLSIGFVTFDEESNTLLLRVSREEYDMIEGRYIRVFSAAISKHYPAAKVQYSIPRESVLSQEAKDSRKAEKGERQRREIQQGIESARAVIENTLGLDKKTNDDMRYAFKLRYKHEPEEYLKIHTSKS